jgi:hypothetical protein
LNARFPLVFDDMGAALVDRWPGHWPKMYEGEEGDFAAALFEFEARGGYDVLGSFGAYCFFAPEGAAARWRLKRRKAEREYFRALKGADPFRATLATRDFMGDGI